MFSFNDLKKNLKGDISALPAIRVAIVGDTATQLLSIAIRGTGVERGYNIELFDAPYNQVEQQLLNPNSDLYSFDADFIVVFQSTHKLGVTHSRRDPDQRHLLAEERLAFVSSICTNPALKDKCIIYFNYPEIDDAVFGSYANRVEESFTWQIRHLNCGLMDLTRQFSNLFICDIAALQNKLGRDTMFATNIYTSMDMVLSLEVLPFVSSRVLDIICSIKGKFKKCLILDLDNTIWGGIIGDDGLEGIQLGHGLGIGKAFSEFQLWVKKLRQRGIIICIASKNNEEIAKEPFEKHPDMVLNLNDIAVFQANWGTKVDSIRTIQSVLNIGFDSMVFLDDNPFERGIVRESIPGITVPDLPKDPADYLEFLYGLNLFETANYSLLDNDRTRQYQLEAKRVSYSKSFTDEADYLRSLDMRSSVSTFTKFNIPRIAQLTQRSNQFNLRTVRYTETGIETLSDNPNVIDLCFTLEDKFGDYGLVAVVIMIPLDQESLFIDTWIMSCRVLNRGMELYILNKMVAIARAKGYKHILGEYIPTEKNGLVSHHYPDLGFIPINDTTAARWSLCVKDYQPHECFISTK